MVRKPFSVYLSGQSPYMQPKDKEMRLYACENFTCKLPIDGYEASRMLALLSFALIHLQGCSMKLNGLY